MNRVTAFKKNMKKPAAEENFAIEKGIPIPRSARELTYTFIANMEVGDSVEFAARLAASVAASARTWGKNMTGLFLYELIKLRKERACGG